MCGESSTLTIIFQNSLHVPIYMRIYERFSVSGEATEKKRSRRKLSNVL